MDLVNSQVKVPKYNCPKDLYSDTTMDEMISGTSQIEYERTFVKF